MDSCRDQTSSKTPTFYSLLGVSTSTVVATATTYTTVTLSTPFWEFLFGVFLCFLATIILSKNFLLPFGSFLLLHLTQHMTRTQLTFYSLLGVSFEELTSRASVSEEETFYSLLGVSRHQRGYREEQDTEKIFLLPFGSFLRGASKVWFKLPRTTQLSTPFWEFRK